MFKSPPNSVPKFLLCKLTNAPQDHCYNKNSKKYYDIIRYKVHGVDCQSEKVASSLEIMLPVGFVHLHP